MGGTTLRILELRKKNLRKFLEKISSWGELWAPVKKDEMHVYQKIDDLKDIDIDAGTKSMRTVLPPKKIIVPPKFSMFSYDEKGYQERLEDIPKRILFGVHSCDIHGLLILDDLFLDENPDPYYGERRKNTAILGLSCVPDEHCFCNETRTDIVDTGYDLFFTDLGNFFLVWVGSSLGDDMIRMGEGLFNEDISVNHIRDFIQWKKWRDTQFKLDIDLTAMPDIFELKKNSKDWDKIGERCLACGSCSMVCPTCNCFMVRDKVALTKLKGTRDRAWDSCTLHDYSLVAGEHNFRASRADRLKLWYTHKLQAFIGEFGDPSCVGCGRCLVTCPVDINVYTVTKTLRDEGGYFE